MSPELAVLLVALNGGTALVLAVAIRRQNVAAAVNAVAALVVAVTAASAAEVRFDGVGTVAPALPVWAAVAGLAHAVGMLGPYDEVWWWDHVTHLVSAALVAALAYAGLLVAVGATWSAGALGAATIGYALLAGLAWEVVEVVARALGDRYDVEPVLVHYGWRDTAADIAFDLAGAVAVVALDVRWLVPVAARDPRRAGTLLAASAVVLVTTCLVPPVIAGYRRIRTGT